MKFLMDCPLACLPRPVLPVLDPEPASATGSRTSATNPLSVQARYRFVKLLVMRPRSLENLVEVTLDFPSQAGGNRFVFRLVPSPLALSGVCVYSVSPGGAKRTEWGGPRLGMRAFILAVLVLFCAMPAAADPTPSRPTRLRPDHAIDLQFARGLLSGRAALARYDRGLVSALLEAVRYPASSSSSFAMARSRTKLVLVSRTSTSGRRSIRRGPGFASARSQALHRDRCHATRGAGKLDLKLDVTPT